LLIEAGFAGVFGKELVCGHFVGFSVGMLFGPENAGVPEITYRRPDGPMYDIPSRV
jgi:hypothetical protein